MNPEDLYRCLCFFIAVDLQLSANEDFLEADRIESFNSPWARNLRRKGEKKRARARLIGPNVYDGQVVNENGVTYQE